MRCRIVRETVDAHLDLVGEDTLNGELQKHAAKIGVGDARDVPRLPAAGRRARRRCRAPISTCSRRSTKRPACRCSKRRRPACPTSARRGLRGRLVADQGDGARRRDSRVARRCDPHAARRSGSPRDRWRRWRARSRSRTTPHWISSARVRSSCIESCAAARPLASAAGSSCRRSAGRSRSRSTSSACLNAIACGEFSASSRPSAAEP